MNSLLLYGARSQRPASPLSLARRALRSGDIGLALAWPELYPEIADHLARQLVDEIGSEAHRERQALRAMALDRLSEEGAKLDQSFLFGPPAERELLLRGLAGPASFRAANALRKEPPADLDDTLDRLRKLPRQQIFGQGRPLSLFVQHLSEYLLAASELSTPYARLDWSNIATVLFGDLESIGGRDLPRRFITDLHRQAQGQALSFLSAAFNSDQSWSELADETLARSLDLLCRQTASLLIDDSAWQATTHPNVRPETIQAALMVWIDCLGRGDDRCAPLRSILQSETVTESRAQR